MKFEIIPILSVMEAFYQQPISRERFEEYLNKLQGPTKGDLVLPIGGYNPMAKAHVLEKIGELKALEAERLVEDIVEDLNEQNEFEEDLTIQIVINLADDLKGGWTNYHASDFDSKFKTNALVSRNFCTPFFWTSEQYTEAIIKERTLEYIYRTIYCKQHSRLRTLEEHLNQEIFVASKTGKFSSTDNKSAYESLSDYYKKNKAQEEYSLLFNFFYGDAVSATLNYSAHGVKEINGFEYARIRAREI